MNAPSPSPSPTTAPLRTPALWPALMTAEDSARPDLRLTAAAGHRVTFADGHEALCGTSGLWNVNLGYGNEAVAEASSRAMRDASYLSVFRYTNTYAAQAAEVLIDLLGRDRFARVLDRVLGVEHLHERELVILAARRFRLIGRHRSTLHRVGRSTPS